MPGSPTASRRSGSPAQRPAWCTQSTCLSPSQRSPAAAHGMMWQVSHWGHARQGSESGQDGRCWAGSSTYDMLPTRTEATGTDQWHAAKSGNQQPVRDGHITDSRGNSHLQPHDLIPSRSLRIHQSRTSESCTRGRTKDLLRSCTRHDEHLHLRSQLILQASPTACICLQSCSHCRSRCLFGAFT